MSNELERTVENIVADEVSSKIDSFAADLAERLQSECAELVEHVRKLEAPGAEDSVETLLGCLRDIQNGGSVVDIAGALVEGAAMFCGRAGLFINKGDNLLGFRLAGEGTEDHGEAFQELSIGLLTAASFEQAVDTAANVVSSGAPDDLSSEFVELMGLTPEDRVGLFPVRLRTKVLAVMYCDSKSPQGAQATLQSMPIEALISSAEGWIEAVSTRKR